MESLFTVGQRVVCVDSKFPDYSKLDGAMTFNPGLIEGKTYTIEKIMGCSKCGSVSVHVGISVYGESECGCGLLVICSEYWLNQTRFVPLDFDKAADEEIREALKENILI